MMRALAAVAAGIVVAALVAGVARAAVTPDDVKKRLEGALPVQVLRVEQGEVDGKPAFFVRVMKKAQGDNDAFSVATLAVDGETGQLIPAFRHRASGYWLPDDPGSEPKEILVPENGGNTWR